MWAPVPGWAVAFGYDIVLGRAGSAFVRHFVCGVGRLAGESLDTKYGC